MARQILPIAGAIVGGLIGGPMGAQIGFVAGSLIGNAVDPLQVQGNKIGDNQLQTAAEGGTRAIVFGKGCIRATCLLERGNRIVKKQRQRSGKGGGPVTVNERVYWTFAVGLGEDLVGSAILRIWEGEKLVYDVTTGSTIVAESAEFAQKFRFYDGAEDQLPDPALEAIHGVGNAPYYRGTAYVVFPNFDLTDYREAIPTYRWEVATVAEVTEIGDLTATFTIPGDHVAAYIFPKSNGNIGYFSSAQYVVVGDAYTVGELDNALDVVDSSAITWGTPAIGSPLLWARGADENGNVISADSSNGYCKISQNGTARGYYAPTGFNVADWWYGEGQYQPEYGGLVWLADGSFYLGIRATGSSGQYNRLLLKFPIASGSSISDQQRVTNVVPVGNNKFWMTRSRDGEIHIIGPDGNYRRFDQNLSELENRALGISITGIRGFGVDTGIIAIVRSSPSPRVDFYNLETGVLITSVAHASFNGDENTRVLFTDDSVYVQCRKFVARIECSRQAAASKVPLSSIVSAIHQRCGHTAADYDVAELVDLVSGVVFEQSVTGAEAINSLIGGYFADPADYDGKIHYIKRSKPVVRTLTYDDLIDEPETTQRQNPIEYPRKLHLFAQTSWTGYAATKSTSSRSSPDLNTVLGEVSVTIPVTFDGPDEPAQIVAKLHKINWADAEGEIVWQVTDEHLDLVPTDCVGLSLRGRLTRARITNIEDNPGTRKLTLRVDRQSAYTSDVTGIPLPAPTPPQPSILSPTVNAYMDIPALRDSDDAAAPVYYDAMTGQTDVWPGSVLQRSLDAGANYTNASAASVNAVMGLLQNTVADASPYYTDNGNEVVVKLYMDDEIDSLTDAQFLSEQGAFALSWLDSGVRRWEVMQYRDAEEIADKTWRLTTLHRGRLNSATAAHPAGSLFVLLDTAVRVVDAQSSWIGTDLTHRAVTNGLSPETATALTEPYNAHSQTEWPVAHVLLDHAGNDLTVGIVPRHRFGTSLNPIRSINWTGYRVTATDGSNTASVDTTADTYTLDVTGWASPITVTVAQLNRITGAGPTVTEAIP